MIQFSDAKVTFRWEHVNERFYLKR